METIGNIDDEKMAAERNVANCCLGLIKILSTADTHDYRYSVLYFRSLAHQNSQLGVNTEHKSMARFGLICQF